MLAVHIQFEHQAVSTPDAIALEIGDTALSYEKLNSLANRVAHALIARGTRPGDFIGICLDRSVAMIAGVLGILKAGAAYVPMDTEYPADRLAYMLEDSGVRLLIADSTQARCLKIDDDRTLLLDDLDVLRSDKEHNPGLPVEDEQLIYMIYTSGSTGKPKGSLIYHRGFQNLVDWYVRSFDFDGQSRVLHMTSPAFDLTQKNLFAPLVSGGCLCLLSSRVYDANIIIDHIERHRVTVVNCTPSAFGRLLNFADDRLYRRIASLRYVFLGGEPISVPRLKSWLDNPHCHAQVVNTYGPTECTDVCAYFRIEQPDAFMERNVPIGRALPGFRLYVLDEKLQPVVEGKEGQLCIAGVGVGRGYHNKPDMTAERFVVDPFAERPGERLYLTGDRARVLDAGNIDYLGRIDNQVKVRGFRIELGEIERVLELHDAIKEAAVSVFPDRSGDNRLAAYLVYRPDLSRPSISEVRAFLQRSLPDFMLPTAWVVLDKLPLTPNGKLDRKALPMPQAQRPSLDTDYVAPRNGTERYLVDLWLEYLGIDRVGVNDRFFELGGSSLNAVDFIARLSNELGERIPIATFFAAPTIRGFVAVLWAEHRGAMLRRFPDDAPEGGATASSGPSTRPAAMVEGELIAIIGLAGRFPGAADADELWRNLLDGVEAVNRATDEELRAAGVSEEDIADPEYVRNYFSMDEVEYFDAGFFGYQPRDVEAMDPQHRLFLECAWTALDNAGYADTERYGGRIGVFGGIARDAYLHHYVSRHPRYRDVLGDFAVNMGNDKNFPAARVAYKLNLRGPAVNVQTACSTSGVALHLACQSLRAGESDMALVGGCRVLVPTQLGYRYVEGSALSRDGRLFVFDRRGTGMVRGSGAAFLVIKRLSDALRDGDCIRALIKSTAINNDGSAKVGFTAPSVEGQSEVIAEALRRAGVPVDSIGYVEAHGTATALGDPIEVRGLTRAYRQFTDARQFARLGSIKSNIGHLDAGAATAGIIKTVLSMEHGELPASLNYEQPNPDIDFASSPFQVNAARSPWPAENGQPRRAGVSSFGLGGTNFHCIIEQAPESEPKMEEDKRSWQLFALSAKSERSLLANLVGLYGYCAQYPERSMADLAYSLNTRRPEFRHRAVLVCARGASLDGRTLAAARRQTVGESKRELVFEFPKCGGSPWNAAPGLYGAEPVFRGAMRACAEAVAASFGGDLCERLYPVVDATALADPLFADIAQFSLEYALAQLWMAWVGKPRLLVGEDVGELVAACVAGMLSLADALLLVVARRKGLHEKDEAPLKEALARTVLASPTIPVLAVSVGAELQQLSMDYWRNQLKGVDRRQAAEAVLQFHTPLTKLVMGMAPIETVPCADGISVVPSLGFGDAFQDDEYSLFGALGEVWLLGHPVDWTAVYRDAPVRKVPLPPYRFDRQRYWIDLPSTGSRLLILAAASEQELTTAAGRWAQYFQTHPDADLRALASEPGDFGSSRLSALVATPAEAAQAWVQPVRALDARAEPSVIFMFPGGGAQYLRMGQDLYRQHPVFKQTVDEGLLLHAARTGYDLRRVWFPRNGQEERASAEMERPSVQLPALFIIEIALARLWQHWGVRPTALLGHSMGENTAACIAGVMNFADALGLVALRGRLFERVEPGGMLSVALSSEALRPYLGAQLDLATVNGPEQCTVSGRSEALSALQRRLEAEGVDAQPIPIAIAAHSRWLEPILDEFGAYLRGIALHEPEIPFISNLNGDWIAAEQATDPDYWVRHLRQTVRFGDGVQTLLREKGRVFLECGPGKILGSLVKLQGSRLAERVIPSLRHGREDISDRNFLFGSIGRLWSIGATLDWNVIERDWPGSCLHLPPQPPGTVESVAFAPATTLSNVASINYLDSQILPQAGMAGIAASPFPGLQESAAVKSRKDLIVEKLKAIIYDMSGIAATALDTDTTFLNLGFDSLFLTQANLRFKKAFSVKTTMRQLLNEAPTLGTLAAFIDGQLPADALQEELRPAATPAPQVAANPATTPPVALPAVQTGGALVAGGDALQQAIILQIQASNALLNLIQGGMGGPALVQPAQVALPVAAAPSPIVAPAPMAQAAVASPSRDSAAAHGPFQPVQKTASSDLNDRQRHYLVEFMAAYQRRTAKSKAFAEQHRPHYADPRTVMGFKTLWKELTYTLVGERSKGSHVWDIDGNEYVDCMSGFGAIFFGHAPDFVVEAVQRQLTKTIDYGPQSQLAGPAAQLLCEMTGMERASFCNTGSEAVLAAMRLARTVTGNDLIVVFSGDYHGIFDEVLVQVQTIGNQRQNRPVAPGIPQSASQNILVLDYGDPRSVEVIRERAGEIAAVLIEPIQSRRPELQPREFLHQVRAVTRETGIPMIFDEIITGFRLHPRGAQAWFDVDADIACYGKVIGGGFPVGVVAGKAKYLDALDGGQWRFGDDSFPEVGMTYFAGTFIRHPVALAAVHAVLQYLKQQGPELQQGVNRRAALFAEEINRQYRRRGVPIELNYFGSVFLPRFNGNPDFEGLFHHHLRFHGAHHIWGRRPGFLTAAHTDADIQSLIKSFVDAAEAMQRGGFLPALEDQPRQHYPWTTTQSELWLAIKMGPSASAAYNEQVMFEIEHELDPAALELALDKVLNRHPSLRAVVDANEAGLTLLPYMSPRFTYRDLLSLPEEERDAAVRQQAQEHIDQPFDFFQGPLLRMLLMRVAERRYVLCVCASHLVCDGWSLEIVMEDIATYYTGIRQGRYMQRRPVPSLDELAAAEQAQRAAGDMKEARDYWLKVYGDSLPPDLDLPLDHPRPRQRSYRGERRAYYLDRALNEPMRRYAKEHGCTSFVMMLSVFVLMVHRLTRQDDIVVGIPAAGQPNMGLPGLVAHGVNFLSLRAAVDPRLSFSAFMVAMRDRFMEAKDHQCFGYGELLQVLRVPRDPSRLPLVTVSFNLDMAFNPLDFDGVLAKFLPAPRGLSKYDLLFTLTDQGNDILIEVDRNADIFEASTIDRWVAFYEQFLRTVLKEPARPVVELPMLDAVGRQTMLEEWNATARDYPLGISSLHGLVESAVARYPEVVAVVDAGGALTYADLDARANRLAHYLRAQGVRPDQVIGVLMERSRDMVVALYGILKAGAAYLPLDPEHPAERIRMILEESAAPLVICQEALSALLPQGLSWLAIDRAEAVLRDFPAEAPEASTRPEHLAYVIYTSGSTGRPKGVMNEHRGICNRLLWMQEAIPLGPDDRVLQKTPYTFDVSVWEFFLPLMAGARLVMAAPGGHRDNDYLIRTVQEQRISYLHFVPSMLHLFLAHPDAGRCGGLRCVIASGESLPRNLHDRFFEILPHVQLYNLYGPTEAAVDVTFWACDPNAPGDTVPIGRPVANTQIYLLDEQLQPVPVGVPGELYIGGVQVARGYLNRPDLTAERFVSDPFAADPRACLYKTGDLARYRGDGAIEYIGRNDFQVKVRGLRIELGEIEAALERHADVERCVVVVREDRVNDQRLVAYLVNRSGSKPDNASLREHLRTFLPEYMVPQHFVSLLALPLTSSGKVDRNALPDPEQAVPQSGDQFRAPQGEVETFIAELWGQRLGIERVSTSDNFFDLGGHSLLGTQIFASINRRYEIMLDLRELFDAPTIAQLARLVEARRSGQSLIPIELKIVHRDDLVDPPPSSQQMRLWYLSQVDSDYIAFNLPAAFRLSGPLRLDCLQRALDTIVERHAPLRTNIVVKNGELVQAVRDALKLDLTPVPITAFGATTIAELAQAIKRESARSFDLEHDPLIQAGLVKLDEQDHILYVIIHHIVFDGWSFDIFLRDLFRLYNAYRAGRPNPLPALPVTYADYAIWQQKWLASEHVQQQLGYWIERLSGELPVLDLPLDKPRPPIQPHAAEAVLINIDASLLQGLDAAGARSGATLFMVMLSLYAVTLYRFTRQTDLLIGAPISGRNLEELDGLLGFFINTLVFRLNVDPSQPFSAWIKDVKGRCLQAYDHQYTPFELIIQHLNVPRDQSRSPVYQTLLIYQDVRNRTDQPDGMVKQQVNIELAGAQTDLDFWLKRESDRMLGGFEFPSALFVRDTIATIADSFMTIARRVAERPDISIAELISLDERERKLLADWNATEAAYPVERSLADWLTERVDERAERTAVIGSDRSLSYAELEAQSNQLAHHLRAQGVQRGTLVGLCQQRSERLLVSLLAIWKAGGAYVPLDPDYPEKRLRYMLETAQAPVILTESALINIVADYSCRRVSVDSDWPVIAGYAKTSLNSEVVGENLAYVIFTSGSTGEPKGVQIPHRAVVNFLHSMSREPGMQADDRLLAVTTLSFDIAVLELFLPLLVGATVVIAGRDDAADGHRLKSLLEQHEINLLQATPSTWRLLMATGWSGSTQFRALVGGESLPVDLRADLIQRCGEVWNMYGPTETTVWSTCERVDDLKKPILIGRPIANTQCHIVDDRLQPVPIGVAGELLIGGDGLSSGYLGRPELTAERFVTDNFQLKDTVKPRLYRTGDRVRWRADGRLEYFQRLDNQVKLRGFRIELGEIESVLLSHPQIAECAAAVKYYGHGDHRLVAYIRYEGSEALTNTDLRRFLREQLPDYMVPQIFVEVRSMPLTPNGKIDRKALPEPLQIKSNAQTYVAPRTEAEKEIAAIWSQALKIDSISVDDKFFDIGGHSLLALSVIARIEKKYGVRISPLDMLMNTLEQIATKVAFSGERAGASETEAAAHKVAPTSDQQRGAKGGRLGHLISKLQSGFSDV